MQQIFNIARKEINDGLRNRWLLAISLLFAALAIGIAWFGSVTAGHIGFSSISTTIASLASLATILVPLIALLLAYDAIVGEEENGTLLLLLTYPLNRGQILLGKFLGHAVILALSTLIGFGCAALAIALLVPDIDVQLLSWAFCRFIASASILGWIFLAIAYLLSSYANEKSTAAGLALGVWFLFVLVFDLALLALLVISKGQVSPQLLPWLLLLNPTDIFRQLNVSGFDNELSGLLAFGTELPQAETLFWLCLLIWLTLSLFWAYRRFKAKKI